MLMCFYKNVELWEFMNRITAFFIFKKNTSQPKTRGKFVVYKK